MSYKPAQVMLKTVAICLSILMLSVVGFAGEPTVGLSAPIAGTAISSGTTVTVSGTATGNKFEYYELHFSTGNFQAWFSTGISIPNSTITTLNGVLGAWNTTGLDLSSWVLRLKAKSTDGYQAVAYVKNTLDSSAPLITAVSLANRSSGINSWVKNGDGVIITASISDDQSLITENIWADLTDFGGSRYAAPTDWLSSSGGVATWIVTMNRQTSQLVSATVWVKDFGNNFQSSKLQVTADVTAPEIYIYLNGSRLFSGDFFTSSITLNSIVSENNSTVFSSLSLYQDDVLLQSASNLNGSSLNITRSGLNSSSIKVVAVAIDSAGNITTKNLASLSATSTKLLSEVMCAPNPFNPSKELSHIGYKLSQPGNVKLFIHDIAGQRVFSNSQSSSLGYSEFTWDGSDASGQRVPNGLYFGVVIVDFDGGGSSKFVTRLAVLR